MTADARVRVAIWLNVLRNLVKGGDERRDALRALQFRLVRHVTPVIAVDGDGVRYFVSTQDLGIGLPVFMRGAFDPEQMHNAIEVLERSAGHPFRGKRGSFVDIGANIGTSSVEAIVHHGALSAVAYEPDATNLQLLRHNLLANCLTQNVSVIEAAVTDHCGEVLLERAADNYGDHRVRVGREAHGNLLGEAARPITAVAGVTLDSEIARGALDLDAVGLVSIDTQGHEAQVLAGATRLCDSEVPVMLEYWPYGLRAADGNQRVQEIARSGYRVYVDLANPFARGRIDYRPADELGSLDRSLAHGSCANLLLIS